MFLVTSSKMILPSGHAHRLRFIDIMQHKYPKNNSEFPVAAHCTAVVSRSVGST